MHLLLEDLLNLSRVGYVINTPEALALEDIVRGSVTSAGSYA